MLLYNKPTSRAILYCKAAFSGAGLSGPVGYEWFAAV